MTDAVKPCPCKYHDERLPLRFWRKVAIVKNEYPTPCWIWGGAKTKGYGYIRVSGRSVQAYKFAYEMLVSVVSVEMELDHLCRHRDCVNPEHLEQVTHAENTRRADVMAMGAFMRNKTKCIRGHSLTDPKNMYIYRGSRFCRACRRNLQRARRAS